jgi:predicted metal-dependent HD superfamily phosphohydrolase
MSPAAVIPVGPIDHWRSLEGSHSPSAWDALDGGYGDARRAYHGWNHIAELLEKLDEFRALSAKPALIATAVFWHDAVYVTQATDGGKRSDLENVRDSAELFLRHTLLNADDAAAVHELIMATADHTRAESKKQHYDGFAGDLHLLLDLDLSPLAAPWKIFAANLENIRFEFAWVPEREFYSGQIRMLEGFLKADTHLFRRAETRKKWLAAAKDNLRFCIDALRAKLALEPADRDAPAPARIG